MMNQGYTYLVKPESGRPRPAYWRLAVFLWGEEVDVDSDGNSTHPDDMAWTELTLSKRPTDNQRVDIDPVKVKPLILKIVATTQPLAAQAAYFLAAQTEGKISKTDQIIWRSPRSIKGQLDNFDVNVAMIRATRWPVTPEFLQRMKAYWFS